MEAFAHPRARGTRGQGTVNGTRSHSKHKTWVAGQDSVVNGHSSEGERWERGGHRKLRGSARHPHGSASPHLTVPDRHGTQHDAISGTDEEYGGEEEHVEEVLADVELDTREEREKFYQELVKAREAERKRAITEGKMDDPTVAKRLDEAITIVGTCQDMCPRFERYRRERENNLDKWEVIPGTKRVDHKRAVKIYERAAGDKSIPSDIRPPLVLRKTLDYLFHELLMGKGFRETHTFIRDRSRAVRNDFTLQHDKGPIAIESHDRCARYHILALHFQRSNEGFSAALEEQQLMNTLQSLKEFYEDQRGKFQASTELEMRVYHRLIHIRDQKERHELIPDEITSHPVFQLTTKFRLHVQAKSAPISKTSPLIVDSEGMQIFGQLANVLREQNNVVMIYLVACILERLFGEDTIDNIEGIRADLSIPDIIDGRSAPVTSEDAYSELTSVSEEVDDEVVDMAGSSNGISTSTPASIPTSQSQDVTPHAVFGATASPKAFAPQPSQPVASAFGNLKSIPNVFGTGSVFGTGPVASVFGQSGSTSRSVFGGASTAKSGFGSDTSTPKSVFGIGPPPTGSIFGGDSKSFGPSTMPPTQSSSPFGGVLTPPPVQSTSPSNLPAEFPSSGLFGTTRSTAITSAILTPPAATPSAFTHQLQPHFRSQSKFPRLDPLVPSFAPTTQPPLLSSSASTAPSPSGPSPVINAAPTAEPVRSFQPPTSFTPNIFGGSSSSISPPLPPGSVAPTSLAAENPTTPRIVERRQTLWDIPSSSTPSPRPSPVTPILIPEAGPSRNAPSPISLIPPQLNKIQPISLPSTPTATSFDANSPVKPAQLSPTKRKSILGFPVLQMPSSASSAEILSPLVFPSPGALRPPPVQGGSPSPQQRTAPSGSFFPVLSSAAKSSSEAQANGHTPSKGKARETTADLKETAAELREKAKTFLNRSCLVKKYFKTWLRKTTDRAASEEAYQRSEAYRRKLDGERMSSSVSSDKRLQHSTKRRRASGFTSPDTVQSKRAKRRISAPHVQPLTDEDLARRLKENHEEHEHRWAQGSFLRTVRQRVSRIARDRQCPPEWRLWLSTNPENDGTAIWLEHKFNIPASGVWENEGVFSMPGSPDSGDPGSRGAPGLIIFERTPLEGVEDEIERKFRILEDCSRLRDLVKSLPPVQEMRFLRSLVVVSWSEEDITKGDSSSDFSDMTSKLVEDGVIANVATFAIPANAKDLDQKFEQLLSTVSLNAEDQMTLSITWKKLVYMFTSRFKSSASDWLHNCWADDTLDWIRYGHVLRAIHAVLNDLLHDLLSLVAEGVIDAEVELPTDLQTPSHLERDYATGDFVESLANLPIATAEQILRGRMSMNYVLHKADVEIAVGHFENALVSYHGQLLALPPAAALIPARPSPKRRTRDDDMLLDDSPPSLAKKARSSSTVDEDGASASPPPSTSFSNIDNAEKPLVTVAMLRALTQDVLKTYGRH